MLAPGQYPDVRNGSVPYLRSTGKSPEHEVPDSRFKRGINEVYTLVVFSQKGFPKISDAENARAVSQCRLEAGRIIQVSSYYFRAQLLERFRRFRIRTSREAAHLRLA
jgi:hypothetical protein